MRDPHVVSLRYRLPEGASVSFEDAPPINHETDAFDLRLADGLVTFTMKEHHATVESARQVVDPYVLAWTIHHCLWAGRPEIHFEYEDAELIDRDPPPAPKPGEPRIIQVEGIASVPALGSVTISVTRRAYPEPPIGFALNPDVETLWRRWEGYLGGREQLPSMAYFCLTVLQMHGKRKGAASRFGISSEVLATLARLSSERGDVRTARKASGTLQPLSGPDQAWLEAAVRAIIRRAGEVAADPGASQSKLTMADLPPL